MGLIRVGGRRWRQSPSALVLLLLSLFFPLLTTLRHTHHRMPSKAAHPPFHSLVLSCAHYNATRMYHTHHNVSSHAICNEDVHSRRFSLSGVILSCASSLALWHDCLHLFCLRLVLWSLPRSIARLPLFLGSRCSWCRERAPLRTGCLRTSGTRSCFLC